jgi:hypothetical protein
MLLLDSSRSQVSNPAFTASGGSFIVQEGDNYTGEVGTIDDSDDPDSSPGNFSATFVTAGGTNIPVTVNDDGEDDGYYTVDANNGGPFKMPDNGQGTLTVSETGSASQSPGVAVTVTPAPVSVTGIDFTTAVNQSGPNSTVATFTGADPSIAGEGNYTAAITWGDGNQSNGTVSFANGVYSVQGANAYATPGTYAVTIAVTDQGALTYGGSSSPATGTCTATAVQVQSLTVADGSGYETPVTESNGGSGQTAYYMPNDDGSGSLNISAGALPATSAAYAATEYVVTGPTGTVQSGPLSGGQISVTLAASGDPNVTYTVSAGTYINGFFSPAATITAAPTTISADNVTITVATSRTNDGNVRCSDKTALSYKIKTVTPPAGGAAGDITITDNAEGALGNTKVTYGYSGPAPAAGTTLTYTVVIKSTDRASLTTTLTITIK